MLILPYNQINMMTRQIRAIIFWSMFVLFLIFSPIAIFYALDYSYDWQNKKLVQNGAFYFKSSPRNAEIFINSKNKKNTPRFIKRLIPKNYTVEIKKDGFQPWKKELSVMPGIVTEAKYILLIAAKPQLTLIVDDIKHLRDYFPGQFQTDETKKQSIKKLAESSLTLKKYDVIASPNHYAAILANATTSPASLTNNHSLYLLNEDNSFNLLAKDVIAAEFSSDNKKILWYTDHEIWVYWLAEDYNYLPPYKKAGDIEFITRYNEKINQAVWYQGDDQHIIFTIGDTIKIVELDDRDQKNIFDIVNIKNPEILSKDKSLYIFSENKIYKTQLENWLF